MRALLRPILVILLLLAPSAPLPAQETVDLVDIRLALWGNALDDIESETERYGLTGAESAALRERLTGLLEDIGEATGALDSALRPLYHQRDALGPPPAEGEPPEAGNVAAERTRLDAVIARFEGRMKQADLLVTRAKDLETRLSAVAREERVTRLLQRGPFPLAGDTISRALPEFLRHWGSMAEAPGQWWTQLSPAQQQDALIYRVLLVLVLAVLVGLVLRRLLIRYFGRDPAIREPSYARRLTAASTEALANGLIPALIFGGILNRMRAADGLVTGLFADMLITFCEVMIFFVVVRAAARAGLAPYQPAWRLVEFVPENARTLARRITLLAGVFAFHVFMLGATTGLDVSLELESLFATIAVTIEAGLLIALMPARLWRIDETKASEPDGEEAAAPSASRFWTVLRFLVVAIAFAAVVAMLLGYGGLGFKLIRSLVLSGAVIGGLYLVRGLFREMIGGAMRSDFLQDKLALRHPTRNLFKFWARALLDLLIFLLAVVLLLLIWGVPVADLRVWVRDAVEGFQIGNVTISLGDIFAGLVVFTVAMLLTRLLQQVLNEKVLPQTSLDTGVRHSISAGLGYVGVALAAALAISAVGLDLSNLALIAGALSVGIGFGLQNVVNNFVSGLILLIERPIKVGDWIIASGHEGYVKRINVRATELETFQRASVIIPNSELISSSVINWTHKNKIGRVEVPVGVAYGTDVDLVIDTLMECLRADDRILNFPEPFVLFQGFGDSSLDFEARGYIGDVEWVVFISSDLRIRIARAFKEKGIEIPFPQRDLHLKDIDKLVGALNGPDPVDDDPDPASPAPRRRRPPRGARVEIGEAGDGDGGGDT